MANLLIVDDEPGMRQLLSHVFGRAGHAVRAAENGSKALELLRQEPADLIVSDVKMPDMNGIELLRRLREFLPDAGVVMMTAFATVETAREAFKLGADDFIQKPFDVDELKLIVEKALERLRLLQENRAFRRAQRERGRLDQIIGHSQKMQAVYQMIETVAQVQSTVLITGESGTGKEMVARAIHNLSPRVDKPFMPINCGAFTETLLESELFGYTRGAFTGATANRKGLFEAADKGTIFLDEVGEMSPTMQVKLLRVLQERKVRPVGAHEETSIDTRVIAATNRDLAS
ncbi:MAG TPA: sigma-54 dependent transcriptional regulator, partial [Pyrinomonadaceae bacterium]